jgi:Uma2 family endonuclease
MSGILEPAERHVACEAALMADSRYPLSRMTARGSLPDLDDRLVMPETRAEILNGRLIMEPPADEPHGRAHLDLAFLIRAHVAPGYLAACDMLTRTSRVNDFAPDVSVYPEGEPRRLDELSFEVTSKQRLRIPTEKARELIRRGVRRVFAVLVEQKRVLEWDRDTDGWSTITGVIEDRCFVRPIAVAALVDAAEGADEAARALIARDNRVIAGALDDAEARGLRRAVYAVAAVLELPIDELRAAQIAAMDTTTLRALIARITTLRAWD